MVVPPTFSTRGVLPSVKGGEPQVAQFVGTVRALGLGENVTVWKPSTFLLTTAVSYFRLRNQQGTIMAIALLGGGNMRAAAAGWCTFFWPALRWRLVYGVRGRRLSRGSPFGQSGRARDRELGLRFLLRGFRYAYAQGMSTAGIVQPVRRRAEPYDLLTLPGSYPCAVILSRSS